MKKARKSILLLAVMGVFFMNGCGVNEQVQETPGETFVHETLSSAEEQTTAVNETQSETPVPDEESAKTEPTAEPKSGNDQEMKTAQMDSDKSTKAESASESKPNSGQETKTTQPAPVKEVKYTDIVHIFKPYEQAVEISLQIPEDWNYTIWDVEEESPQWGYSIQVLGRDDATFHIFGQFGTLTANNYSNGPKSVQTSQGLTGQYFWDEYMLDDKNPAIGGMIVFDTELLGFYGVNFNMPKSVYNENKDVIDKVFQSIVIKQAQ